MKNARLCLLVLACLAALPMEARAQASSGNELLPVCQTAVDSLDKANWKDASEAFSAGLCLGLVEGIAAAAFDVCEGPDVTNSQLERVVLKFLVDNPQKLDRNRMVLIHEALSKAFPCPKKK